MFFSVVESCEKCRRTFHGKYGHSVRATLNFPSRFEFRSIDTEPSAVSLRWLRGGHRGIVGAPNLRHLARYIPIAGAITRSFL